MRWELLLIIVAGVWMGNVYTDGKFLTKLLSYKKYYHMAGIFLGACTLFWLLKKDPRRASRMLEHSNEYLKYLPVDKNTSSIISPILDFTSKQSYSQNMPSYGNTVSGKSYSVLDMLKPTPVAPAVEQVGGVGGGKKATKRSVSETKKKYVASSQNWKCGDCQEQLSAWYEVDHKIRLEYGGSNNLDNLVALCRECHGRKTTIENL